MAMRPGKKREVAHYCREPCDILDGWKTINLEVEAQRLHIQTVI